MMKKWIAALMALALTCAPACAMERAASLPDHDRLARYAAYESDGETWLLRSNQTAAALRRMGGETAPYNGFACFGLELTGDVSTGLTAPVLAFYYAGSSKLNAASGSVAVGKKRYDMTFFVEPAQLGRAEGERMTALLDGEGLDMVREMLEEEEIYIRLQGEDTTFVMEPRLKDSYSSAREELSARSLEGLKDMLAEFDRLNYRLFDLNDEWWERTRGVKREMSVCALPGEDRIEDLAARLEKPMYALYRGDQGNAVRDLQNLLIDKGYMQGRADNSYGAGTVQAVRAAQTWLGLTPTGAADEKLIRLLEADAVPAMGQAEGPKGEMKTFQGVCEISIDRFWSAGAVESSGGDRRAAADQDNRLVVFEGWIRSLAQEDLDLYWKLSANACYEGHEFPCVLVCEKNDGQSLASSLTQLGQGRLLIYAEAPREIADKDGWTLEIKCGDETVGVE